MTRLCLYFGTDMPDRSWARSLHDTDVVLEPYHPLVKDGGFADVFPHATRFVYVNPTTVDPWVLERTLTPPPLLGMDARWQLPRLDLSTQEAFDWAVADALHAFNSDSGQVHGLFVDDLDRLLPAETEVAMDYFVSVRMKLTREPRWFVNRAFTLWPLLENLHAVLLEDITPELAGYAPKTGATWLREVVIKHARAARERGVGVHSLGYRDQESLRAGALCDEDIAQELAAIVDSVTVGAERTLHEWRIGR